MMMPLDPGTLYVVATPLGNLDDLSPRAFACLAGVDIIFAEDTRRTRQLLQAALGRFELAATLPKEGAEVRMPDIRSSHAHNEAQRQDQVVNALAAGKRAALVSDAGTPAVSDPGAVVVQAVREAGYRVTAIPGPSALTTALAVAGFAEGGADVLFVGFLPAKGSGRNATIERMLKHAGVAVAFESPRRVLKLLDAVASSQVAGSAERQVCVCRELTKVHETVVVGTAAEVAQGLCGGLGGGTGGAGDAKKGAETVLGEVTVVLGARTAPSVPKGASAGPASAEDQALQTALQRCLQAGMSGRDAATAVAAMLELPRRKVYQLLQHTAGTPE